ncbi:hypothetical protein [Prosthecomicrobium sp. N25]|uniref:hypothetical protein n=1 Tax=Prosthecomicrobium sp. N25 TaxID=3129254 RepID=UPI0030769197
MSTKALFDGDPTRRNWPDWPARITPEVIAGAIGMYSDLLRSAFPNVVAAVHPVEPSLREDEPTPDDLEVAVVFEDGGWSHTSRIVALGELAFDVLMVFGVRLHGRPYTRSEWDRGVDGFGNPIRPLPIGG